MKPGSAPVVSNAGPLMVLAGDSKQVRLESGGNGQILALVRERDILSAV